MERSEDKSIVLALPLGTEKDYIISKGRLFQKKKTSGTWERYLLPIEMGQQKCDIIFQDIVLVRDENDRCKILV